MAMREMELIWFGLVWFGLSQAILKGVIFFYSVAFLPFPFTVNYVLLLYF